MVTEGKEFSDVIRSEVEGFVIKWSQEVDEVLSMESQKEIEEGKNPGPEIEIKFWQIRFANLQNLHDQLTSSSSKSMVNILKLTKSGYLVLFRLILLIIQYLNNCVNELFRNIYRNVVWKLSEAQDIALHLTPLINPLKVILMRNDHMILSEPVIAGTENCGIF